MGWPKSRWRVWVAAAALTPGRRQRGCVSPWAHTSGWRGKQARWAQPAPAGDPGDFDIPVASKFAAQPGRQIAQQYAVTVFMVMA